jgi:hypothetical protein
MALADGGGLSALIPWVPHHAVQVTVYIWSMYEKNQWNTAPGIRDNSEIAFARGLALSNTSASSTFPQ